MVIRVGIDEAGYGPTLGPLVTVATAWECAEGTDAWDLAGLLAAPDRPAPRIADSKRVFTPGRGLAQLETAAGAVLAARFGRLPATMAALVESLTSRQYPDVFAGSPWFSGDDLQLPVVAEGPFGQVSGVAAFVTARIVDVPRFNALVRSGLNKATLLFNEVCSMLAETAAVFPGSELQITVDRLGGRAYYKPLLAKELPKWLIETCMETQSVSTYILRLDGTVATVSFLVRADETEFPVAAASLVAKYLRELAMLLFNRHFRKPNTAPCGPWSSSGYRNTSSAGSWITASPACGAPNANMSIWSRSPARRAASAPHANRSDRPNLRRF